MQIQGVPEAYIERGVTLADALLVIAVAIVSLAVYFLPSIIGRRKRRASAITRLNLFLGWTVIGWIVAMHWALKADDSLSER
jgi:uncharacterized membrane protein